MAETADPFAPLRERFRLRLVEDERTLGARAGGQADDAAIVTVAHRIAGLAGTLGYAGLSEAAKLVEQVMISSADQTAKTSAIAGLKVSIRDAIEAAPEQ